MSAASAGEGVDSVRDHTRNNLRRFVKSRERAATAVDDIVNLLSKRSYLTPAKVQAALGSAVKPTALAMETENELFDRFIELNEAQGDMGSVLEALEVMYLVDISLSEATTALDPACMRGLIPQLKQQLLLERAVAAALTEYGEHNANHDALTTMVACFKFPPYLRESDLAHVMNI